MVEISAINENLLKSPKRLHNAELGTLLVRVADASGRAWYKSSQIHLGFESMWIGVVLMFKYRYMITINTRGSILFWTNISNIAFEIVVYIVNIELDKMQYLLTSTKLLLLAQRIYGAFPPLPSPPPPPPPPPPFCQHFSTFRENPWS